MHIDLTADQVALRDELRAYFSEMMTPEVEAAMSQGEWGGSLGRDLALKMGRDGWLGIGWPKEYGGQGRSSVEQFIFFDEAQRAGAPVPFLTINTVGPTLMRYGSDEQRAAFLPPILRGEVTAESTSVFVEVDPARMREMFKETADTLRRDQEP